MFALLLCLVPLHTCNSQNILFLMADQLRFDALSFARTDNSTAFYTPSLDRIASEGISVSHSYSSTPTCTPARAAILTGQSPWHHGMIGYGQIASRYPYEFPRILSDSQKWITASIGKDHFGWNVTRESGVAHGYQTTMLYDGLGSWDTTAPHNHTGEFDDYDQWFASVMPGKDPQATLDHLDGSGWNGWNGAPYVFPEYYHPTAWVGRRAVTFLQKYASESAAAAQSKPTPLPKPFLLKVSFHRPHSPYDPPQRLLDTVRASSLPPYIECLNAAANNANSSTPVPADNSGHGAGWCLRFRGNVSMGDPVGCGPDKRYGGGPDAWCGRMPGKNATLGRRAYAASVNYVDEQIGHIYDALSSTSLLNNTWIIFTADHGDGQGDHYHWRKGFPYEFSSHVPMIVRWPASYHDTLGVSRGDVISPPVVTELRDIFHTIVDIANLTASIPAEHFTPEDGKSMLCLLKDPSGKSHCQYVLNPGPWRTTLDMEHNICYNNSNHWSAVTDGRIKYIYRANFGDEQLFDLIQDPMEKVDVSNHLEQYGSVLKKFRNIMIDQFVNEKRGDDWTKNGKLVRRKIGTTYSPNYPSSHQELS